MGRIDDCPFGPCEFPLIGYGCEFAHRCQAVLNDAPSRSCVMGDGFIGSEPFFCDDGDFIHQRCALASLDRAIDKERTDG